MIIPPDNGFFTNFPGHSRFSVPEPVYRVTGGFGGETYLIVGSEKTALYDCGMAASYRETISNIHELLDPLSRTPDYIVLSHTHYDHIGALPYFLREWPDAQVAGSPYCAKVFASDRAKETMVELGENARDLYGIDCGPITAEGMRLDLPMEDGEELDLGDVKLVYYEAKGHTNCSACYMVLPKKILFANESVSQIEGPGRINTSPLKSFQESIETAEKLDALDAEYIISMHYGLIPPSYNHSFFSDYIEEAKWERRLITKGIENGLSDQEISDIHDKMYWTENRRLNQPYDAHHLNTTIIISSLRKELDKNGEL